MIYAVKRGRKTGIYDEWKKCYEQTNKFSRAVYHSFSYKTELEEEDENKAGSLRHAFMLAEKYMSEFDIGGLKLVYQGRKKDYLEEASWKKEGFLPFGEEIPEDADNLEGDGENDGISENDSICEYDDIDEYNDMYEYNDMDEYDDTYEYNNIEEYNNIYEYDDKDENDGIDGINKQDVFIRIDNDIDEELPFAFDFPSNDAEPEIRKEQEASSEKSTAHNDDHAKEEELYSKLHIPARPNRNAPWVEMLLYATGRPKPVATLETYVGRYHVPALYTTLLMFVFEPEKIINSFFDFYRLNIFPKIKDTDSLKAPPAGWVEDARKVWEDSDEYRALKQRFEKNGMENMDLDELRFRCGLFAEDDKNRRLTASSTTYRAMKNYIRQGGHSLSDLYREITEKPLYRKELIGVSGAFINPDLEKTLHKVETKASFKQLTMHAESIGVELKDKVIGQDDAIDKLERAFFHTEIRARLGDKRKGPRNVFLFAGPPGVGKTFMAQSFADELGIPFKRFDMSGYPRDDSTEELTGISTFWKSSKPGVLTDYVNENPHSVLLFDEIEKASGAVIRLFLQILDDGICFDRYYDANISFEDTIIIFTTNAGRQRYRDAENENLTALPDKLVLEALEKDINPDTKNPYFPPEILSRMSSHTVIMLNHLKAEALRRVVELDVKKQLKEIEDGYGYNLSSGQDILAQTVLYSMGGGADARNASRLAGKLIDQQMYEFMTLMMEKMLSDNIEKLKKIVWRCDFTGATDEVKNFYSGEKNCVVSVLGAMEYKPSGPLKTNDITVKHTTDPDAFMEMFYDGNVLFAVIDYALGMDEAENSLNIADARTVGRDVFLQTVEKESDIPVYILCGGESGYKYSDREKKVLTNRGAHGFIDREFYEHELEAAYRDVCCQRVMDTLALRHQVLTYKTKKEIGVHCDTGKIEFYDLKLETAVESEDRSLLLTDDLRPQKSWDDIYVSEDTDIRKELISFISYLKKPKEYAREGMRTPKGVLLYGPAGTGKTSLAKVVASESHVNFLSLPADRLRIGGADMVRHVFHVARKYAPAILFIDEIDAIGASRASYGINSVLNALLDEMDGFVRRDDKPVFIMAATNLYEDLDDALKRRFDRKCYVPLPDKDGREWMLQRLLKAHSSKIVLSEKEIGSIVDRSEGMSLAKLEDVFEAALREYIRSGKMIDDALFDEIFERCRDNEVRETGPIGFVNK